LLRLGSDGIIVGGMIAVNRGCIRTAGARWSPQKWGCCKQHRIGCWRCEHTGRFFDDEVRFMKKGGNRISGLAYTCRGRPFAWAPWFDLAVKTGEMLGASAYVIGHRADRLARAGTKPSARDGREFTRMVEEKFEAAADSAAAMAPRPLEPAGAWCRNCRSSNAGRSASNDCRGAAKHAATEQRGGQPGRRRITQARLEPRAMRTQGLKAGACACRGQPQTAEQA
jgi:hypothetical protein